MPRGRWIWDRALKELVPAAEFYARKYSDVAASDTLSAPMLMKDVEPYRSVVTGEVIGGRRQHREHLKQHNCIEVGNEMPKARTPEGPKPGEIAASIKRAMEDPNLRAEALAAEERAQEAIVE